LHRPQLAYLKHFDALTLHPMKPVIFQQLICTVSSLARDGP